MKGNIYDFLNNRKTKIAVALFILALGIFFRTYKLHDWLYFYPDQSRDAVIAEDVINGKTPWPELGAIAASTPFRIGPMYYYFQIISGKIFGTGPDKMAYPDLFFGILSIPLLYYFLRRYFSVNLSLAMTGLYSISFYAVRYSRFAWNPNPMPFFVMFFLISFSEFLYDKEKTKWWWIIIAGIATGVGMQLHTILFLLLPAVAFLVFVYLMVKNFRVWKKIVAIIAIAILLNVAQITSELRTGFENTKLLFALSSGASEDSGSGFLANFTQDVLCNAQANTAIISSLGDKDECDFYLTMARIKKHTLLLQNDTMLFLIGVALSLAFSVLGYLALFYYCKKEKDERKKYFLGLIILYVALSFAIMFPVIDGISLRYFIYLIFIPFMLLAFIIKFLYEKFPKAAFLSSVVIISIFAIANLDTIIAEAKLHFEKVRGSDTYVVLGELEDVADYVIAQSYPQKTAHLVGTNKSRLIQNYFKPLDYVLNAKGFDLLRASSDGKVVSGTPAFYMGMALDDEFLSENPDIKKYRNFGQVSIYQSDKSYNGESDE